MSTTFFDAPGPILLPVGTVIVTHYAGWTLDRELRRSQRKRIEQERKPAQ